MDALSILTLLSCFALCVDVILQVRRIHQTKSSNDLSLVGMAIRYFAVIVILIKFISLKDMVLIVGQSAIVATFTVYFILATLYSRQGKRGSEPK